MQTTGNSPIHLCGLLEIERPVILAPMAKLSGGALAAAVSSAGGLGVVGGGYGDIAWIAEQVELARGARIGIGLITWNLVDGALEAVLGHEPSAVWLSFGDPSPHIAAIHEAGSVAICQVGTVAEAISAAGAGADVIVAQGSESGGHGRSGRALFGLLPAISAAIPDIALVAAGGINDSAGLQAATALGAAGVAMGSAFYASVEALDVDAAKQRLIEAKGDDTVRSRVYDQVRGPLWPQEYTGRTIRTSLTQRWADREDELADVVEGVQEQHRVAVVENDMSVRVVWAGEGIDAIEEILPAADIVRRFAPVR